MYTVFTGVRNFVKCKDLYIDHSVFRLHYKITFYLLLVACALVGSKQYAGEPIRCSSNTQDSSAVVESYCFITSTYTVKNAYNKTPSDGAPHPGIYHSQNPEDYRYHVYYQWVGFVLFLQAVMFYFPHWLWKRLEGGQLARLVQKDSCDAKDTEVLRLRHRNKVVNALRNRWRMEMSYCLKYFFCEFLCLVNIFCQLLLVDKVLDGEFLNFGIEVIQYFMYGPDSDVVECNPFYRVFPRVTSCTYRYYGEGGRVRKSSVLCVLAVNVINEKVFLFMWFWFCALGIVTFVSLVYKMVVFSSKFLRFQLLEACFRNVCPNQLRVVVQNGNIGDYLLIYLLGQNLDPSLFDDVIEELNTRFG